MPQIQFTITGAPVPKLRPKFRRCRNFVITYTPKKTRIWECNVRVQARRYKPEIPWQGPIRMTLLFLMPRPKSLPKKVIYHIKKPDLDNLAKAIKDALQGIMYVSDSQVVYLILSKVYAAGDPRVEVKMEAMISQEKPERLLL